VGTADLGQALVDHIDHHHPKLGSRLMKLRWGGLRTIEPQPVLAPAIATGIGAGLTARLVTGRRPDGRPWVPLLPATLLATLGVWIGVWRWDAARWRRSHVMVVVELPDERLDALIARLAEVGLEVQRWDRPRRADGPVHGLSCRLRDLRRVNAAVDDEITGARR
jgi:hypothetical protein